MATYNAEIVRAVAIELREKTEDLYANLFPIYAEITKWTLNGLDPALPAPYDVKLQVDAYKALVLERLKLEPWASDIQKALIDDTLTYPLPPVFFDGGTIFDGGGDPEGEPAP